MQQNTVSKPCRCLNERFKLHHWTVSASGVLSYYNRLHFLFYCCQVSIEEHKIHSYLREHENEFKKKNPLNCILFFINFVNKVLNTREIIQVSFSNFLQTNIKKNWQSLLITLGKLFDLICRLFKARKYLQIVRFPIGTGVSTLWNW